MNKSRNNVPIRFNKQFEIALHNYSGSESGDFDGFFQVAIDVLENKENIAKWVETELRALSYKTPIEALYLGQVDEVIDELIRLQDGVHY